MSPTAPDDQHAYRAPASRADARTVLSEDAPIPAEFGIRAAARVLDIVVVFLLALASAAVAGVVLALFAMQGWLPPDWQERMLDAAERFGFAWLGASVLYHATCEAIGGATLGKLACGIRVWADDRTPCTWFGGIVRNLGFLIDALFFGVVGFMAMSGSPERRRIGDRWGRTIVVLSRSISPSATPPSAGIGVFVGMAIAMATMVGMFVLPVLVSS